MKFFMALILSILRAPGNWGRVSLLTVARACGVGMENDCLLLYYIKFPLVVVGLNI